MRQFNTLTGFLLSKSSNPTTDDTVEFQGYSVIGDGGGATWQHNGVTGQTPSQSPAQLGDALLNDGNGNQWELTGNPDIFALGTNNPTIKIPGRFLDLQEACDFFAGFSHNSEQTITLEMQPGFEITTPLAFVNVNSSFIEITSVDAEVKVGASFPPTSSVINSVNSRPAILNTIIDVDNIVTVSSYNVSSASIASIAVGAGMKNGGDRGLHSQNGSTAYADNCVFTGFQKAGVHASRNSRVQCADADFSGNSQNPANTFGAIYASRGSVIHGPNMNATNSGAEGVRAQRGATIVCPDVDLTGCTGTAMIANGGTISTTSGLPIMLNLKGQALVAVSGGQAHIGAAVIAHVSGVTDPSIECRNARVIANGVNISGQDGRGIYAEGVNAMVDIDGGVIAGGTDCLFAFEGGSINAVNSTITGASNNGATATQGGKIIIAESSVTGSGNDDLSINKGSWMSANSCTTTNGVGTPDISDTNLTGGFNFADNGNRGFIWS